MTLGASGIHLTAQVFTCSPVVIDQNLRRAVSIAVQCRVQNLLMLGGDVPFFVAWAAGRKIPIADVQVIELGTISKQQWQVRVPKQCHMKGFVRVFKVTRVVLASPFHMVMAQDKPVLPGCICIGDGGPQCCLFKIAA